MTRGALLGAALVLSGAGALAEGSAYTPEEIAEYAADAGLVPAQLTTAGDAEYGEYLGGECTTCHQQSGDSNGIPAIVYLDDLTFRLAMYAYKAKTRENAVMQMTAGKFGDEEIAALAAYFTTLDVE
ncbi:c-type cytochrome [Pseudaestuariivita sp.]|uniref:c-type cytochrome n=1 Tax=Pseudaestuariivita sp. TaxID=2211669 RepID=UPI004059973D